MMKETISKLAVWLLYLVAALCLLATVFSFTARDQWWIRMVDYVALPILVITCLTAGIVLWRFKKGTVEKGLAVLLGLSIVYQVYVLHPYILPVDPQVPTFEGEADLTIMSANVKMENREGQSFLNLVQRSSADIVLVLETSERWVTELEALDELYPYQVLFPQENHYGMSLYSKIPLDAEVLHFDTEKTPTIRATFTLNEEEVVLWCVHPRPPLPGRKIQHADRELIAIGRLLDDEKRPVIVAGDFNDVPWSYTVGLLITPDRLRDARVGRGFFPTFDAQSPFVRTPIDHLLLSKQWKVRFQEPQKFSSDHLAIIGELQLP